MSKNNFAIEGLIADLSDEQLDELLAYVPAFSESSLDNIEARSLGMINSRVEAPKRKLSIKKVALTFLAAVLLLALSTAVLAAVTDLDFGQIFNSFFRNPTAANVMDIGKTVEANGIEITVLQAFTDGNEVHAVLEIRDLYASRLGMGEGMRLMFDMNTLGHAFTPIVYNETSGTAIVGININRHFSPIDIGEYLSFSVESLMRTEFVPPTQIEFPLWLHAVEKDMICEEEWINEAASRGSPDGGIAGSYGQFLKLGELHEYLPGVDWAVLTNIGVYGDYLHVQTRRTDTWDPSYGNIRLVDTYGAAIWAKYGAFVGDYREEVFYIGDIENLYELSLAFGGGTVTTEAIHGPWDFYFPITARAERISVTMQLEDSLHFGSVDVEISPMLTTIHLSPIANEDVYLLGMIDYVSSFNVPFITLSDGSRVELFMRDSMFCSENGGSYFFSSLYFDILDLHSITILDMEYHLN